MPRYSLKESEGLNVRKKEKKGVAESNGEDDILYYIVHMVGDVTG